MVYPYLVPAWYCSVSFTKPKSLIKVLSLKKCWSQEYYWEWFNKVGLVLHSEVSKTERGTSNGCSILLAFLPVNLWNKPIICKSILAAAYIT